MIIYATWLINLRFLNVRKMWQHYDPSITRCEILILQLIRKLYEPVLLLHMFHLQPGGSRLWSASPGSGSPQKCLNRSGSIASPMVQGSIPAFPHGSRFDTRNRYWQSGYGCSSFKVGRFWITVLKLFFFFFYASFPTLMWGSMFLMRHLHFIRSCAYSSDNSLSDN